MPYFSDAERAALELTESVNRLDGPGAPFPDHVWKDAAGHYDETQLAGLIIWIATINMFNRINASIRQPVGQAL
jgi:alkylhydroperoxidase family enzyme